MPAAWESEREEERWSDREAWRGDEHAEDCDAWRLDVSEDVCEEDDWYTEEEEESLEEDTPSGWPEDLAGPEYWMYKDFED